MSYEVKLTYFAQNGKQNGKGSFISNKKKVFEMVEEVRIKHQQDGLPMLGYCDHENYVLVDVPTHPANRLHLLKPCAYLAPNT